MGDNRLKTACLVLVFVSFSVAVVSSLEAAGEAGAYFLKIKNSARGAALGEAFVSLADDTSCLQWNPAGLALIDVPSLEFNHRQSFTDFRYENMAGALPIRGFGTLGLGVHYSGVDQLYEIDDLGYGTKASAYNFVGTCWNIYGFGR